MRGRPFFSNASRMRHYRSRHETRIQSRSIRRRAELHGRWVVRGLVMCVQPSLTRHSFSLPLFSVLFSRATRHSIDCFYTHAYNALTHVRIIIVHWAQFQSEISELNDVWKKQRHSAIHYEKIVCYFINELSRKFHLYKWINLYIKRSNEYIIFKIQNLIRVTHFIFICFRLICFCLAMLICECFSLSKR